MTVLHGIIEAMRNRLALAFFAAAILFSMVREWSAPTSCPRGLLGLEVASTAQDR
jgi:hypothetical protein